MKQMVAKKHYVKHHMNFRPLFEKAPSSCGCMVCQGTGSFLSQADVQWIGKAGYTYDHGVSMSMIAEENHTYTIRARRSSWLVHPAST